MESATIEIHKKLDVNLRYKWDQFVSNASPFLQYDYCEIIDSTLGKDLSYRYVIFKKDGDWIGVAPMQVTSAITSNFDGNLPEDHALVKLLVQGLSFGKKKLEFKVIVVGNSLISGELGYLFDDKISIEERARLIHNATLKIEQEEQESGSKISATIVKDFIGLTKEADAAFGSFGYFDFQVDPCMVMPVLSSWKNFDDYLGDLNSKFRTKAKAALKRSKDIEIKELSSGEIDLHKEKIQVLYDQVYAKADFKMGQLNPDSFRELKAQWADHFFFKGFFLKDEMIAFQTGFYCDGTLEAHMVGIDYSFNHEYALYPTMLYSYIDVAISKRFENISFGRTAMEIKSSVGAQDQSLHCFIRHRKTMPNKFLGLLFGFVKPAEHELRNPWKKETLDIHPELLNSGLKKK